MNDLREKLINDKVVIITKKSYRLNRYFSGDLNKYFENKIFAELKKTFSNLNELIYAIMNGLTEKPKCLYCNKNDLKYISPSIGYSKTCGDKTCQNKSKDETRINHNPEDPYGLKKAAETRSKYTVEEKEIIKNKRKETCLKKYGVDNVYKNKESQEKAKQTIINKYGVDNVSKNKDIQRKKQETNLKHWGSKSYTGTLDWKQKTEETNLKKYGVKCAMQNKDIASRCHESLVKTLNEKYGVNHSYEIEGVKEKAIENKIKTCQEKYGVNNYFESSEFIKTMNDRYGVDYALQSEELRKKSRDTLRKHYGVDYLWRDPLKYEEFKSKIKTIYGVDNISQEPSFKNTMEIHRKETCLKKYGVEYPTQINYFANKMMKTRINNNLKNFNKEHYFQTNNFKEKAHKSILERYGVDYASQSEEIQNKMKKTFVDHYGVDHPMKNGKIRLKALSKKGMTQPEKKVFEFLKNRQFDFKYQYDINGKTFDFAIFDNNQLSIIIEIDGEYWHGLLSDIDGVHVNALHDDGRFNKVPNNVKFLVCDSKKIDDIFPEILRIFNIDYEEWIQEIINSLPKEFPYYEYSENRMIKDYEHLCKWDTFKNKSRIGDSTIKNFHKSIYDANIKNHPSPVNAWNDKELLEKCVRNRFIYSSSLSSHSILQGFNVCKIAPKVSVFSASLAKNIIKKYLDNFDEIFDPFSGFSGRMLGTCASGKKYIGQDINENHIKESLKIKQFHNLNASLQCKDVKLSKGEYECLFTCPPYSNKEIWNENEDIKSCDEWIKICLKNFKCDKYVFVVDETNDFKNYIVEELCNNSHFGSSTEKLIIIDKNN